MVNEKSFKTQVWCILLSITFSFFSLIIIGKSNQVSLQSILPFLVKTVIIMIIYFFCSQGEFSTIIELPEGEHEYKFCVDGRWIHDPNSVSTLHSKPHVLFSFVNSCSFFHSFLFFFLTANHK